MTDIESMTLEELERTREQLIEMSADNPSVSEMIRPKLHEIRTRIDLIRNPPVEKCDYCGEPENRPHDVDCIHSPIDPALIVKREAAGYRYYDASGKELHTTSVPMTDDEALEYFGSVDAWLPENTHPRYIGRRAFNSGEYKMMPYEYNYVTEQVQSLARTS